VDLFAIITTQPRKKLIVNKREAKQIQEIFTLYTKLGSGIEVARIMNGKGATTKSWTTKKGNFHAGGKLTPKAIYRILGNPLYIGMIPHKFPANCQYQASRHLIADPRSEVRPG